MLKAFINKPLKLRILRGFILAFSIAFILVVTPTPFRLMAPGIAELVGPMITIETKTYPVNGAFLLPTVVSEPATLLYCLYSFIEPNATLTTDPEPEPMAQSPTADERQMGLSQYFSTIIALEALGYEPRGKFSGLRVLSVDEKSPNQGVLESGDLLVGLGGKRLDSFQSFKEQVGALEANEALKATVRRGGKQLELEVKSFRPQGQSILGILIRPELQEQALPFPVTFDSGTTSGASGGLVFALEIYNRLTPDDLTRGRRIAATGTLEPSGKVGAIDGINFKMMGAQRAECTVILFPKDNQKDLSWIPDGVELIPVESFSEALDALKK